MKTDTLNSSPKKIEYSPNNNTSQNIDIYMKNKQVSQNYNYNTGYNMNLVSPEQSAYNNIQYSNYNPNNNFQTQYYMQTNENLFSPPIEMKNNNMNNNIMNNDNNINNNKNNIKENKEEEVEDPDEVNFRNPGDENKEDSKVNEDDELSSVSEKNSENEQEFKDQLLAQYHKVKRIKNKWKVQLKGCVVQKDNIEIICGKVNGELEREW